MALPQRSARPGADDERLALLHDRRTVARLTDPGPDAPALAAILAAAESVPDHGRLHPWRARVLEAADRQRLSDAYVVARRAEDDDPDALRRAAAKPWRGPCLIAVIARTVEHPTVPAWEQLVAAGCAAYAICLAATALGFGSAWRTGAVVDHPAVRRALELASDERLIGLIHLGTAEAADPPSA